MENNIEFIYSPKLEDINLFFNENQKNQKTFRYFKTREFDILKNHKKTILIVNNKNYLGYGHLDVEHDKIWLGIMVCDKCNGLGIGNKIMKELLSDVYDDIFLTVDKNNLIAINLYNKYEFNLIEEFENYFLMKRTKKI